MSLILVRCFRLVLFGGMEPAGTVYILVPPHIISLPKPSRNERLGAIPSQAREGGSVSVELVLRVPLPLVAAPLATIVSALRASSLSSLRAHEGINSSKVLLRIFSNSDSLAKFRFGP